PGRVRDDSWVVRMRCFLRRSLRVDVLTDPEHAAGDPALAAALGLRAGDGHLRLEIEGRLLAGQGDAAIAELTGLPDEVVAAAELDRAAGAGSRAPVCRPISPAAGSVVAFQDDSIDWVVHQPVCSGVADRMERPRTNNSAAPEVMARSA